MTSPLRLTRLEAYFFSSVFILFPILADWEYAFYEKSGRSPSWDSLAERVIYGLFRLLAYLVYYRFILGNLFLKRYGRFLGQLLLFLVLLNAYMHFVVYGGLMHLSFLPNSVVSSARLWFDASWMHVSVVYVIRELLMVTALGFYRQTSQQEKQLHQLQEQTLQAELNSLKGQLQPHFFFNTLNNIYSLALQQSPQTAPLVAKHADIMRYMLYEARSPLVTLPQEVDFLANYVAVESVRFSEPITIQLETQGITPSVWIEPLLLLPFIENTFKHGLRQEINQGFVQILVVVLGQELILQTRNSKAPHPGLARDAGLGLKNAQKRLALAYPESHWLRIQEDEAIFTLELRLILKNAW